MQIFQPDSLHFLEFAGVCCVTQILLQYIYM